jgi:plasmid replication initiation protein
MENKENTVLYDNHINEIKLHGFHKKDMDLFLVVCKCFMDKHSNIITIPYSDIKKLVDYRKMNRKDFHKNIKKLDRKFYGLLVVIDDEENGYYNSKPLFKDFTADENKQELQVEINEKAVGYFNVFKQYTKIDLLIHIGLQSKYSAILYRILCQYNKNGWWRVTLENFREIFNVPKSYDSRKITQKILEPAVEELSEYMDIAYIIEKDEHKRGKPVKGYKFEYSNKNNSKSVEKKEDKEEPTEDFLDKIIELIDNAQLGIGTKSTMNCAKKAIELNRDVDYIQDIINIVKTQDSDNVGAKLMYLIVNGYDKPKKSTKKPNKFNNFQQRDIDVGELEKMLLQRNF